MEQLSCWNHLLPALRKSRCILHRAIQTDIVNHRQNTFHPRLRKVLGVLFVQQNELNAIRAEKHLEFHSFQSIICMVQTGSQLVQHISVKSTGSGEPHTYSNTILSFAIHCCRALQLNKLSVGNVAGFLSMLVLRRDFC